MRTRNRITIHKLAEHFAEWGAAEVDRLPDASFAMVLKGGKKDADGMTVPRSLRKLPYKNADGSVDAAHARNALARLNQTEGISSSQKATIKAKLESALERADESLSEEFVGTVEFAEDGSPSSDVEVLRVGTIRDRGFVVTARMLSDYVKNFKAGVVGSDLRVTCGHKDGKGDDEAAGWVKDLFVKGKSLMARVEWTELGADKLSKKLFRYVSSELALRYPHADTGKPVSNVFLGAALTNSPALKRQDPIELSEESLTKNADMLKKFLKDLKARKVVLAEDVAFARQMLADADADSVDELTEEIDAIEKRVKLAEKKAPPKKKDEGEGDGEPDEDDMDDEEMDEKDGKKPAKKKLAEKRNYVPLSEHLALKKKFDHRELLAEVRETLVLSEEVPVGFADKDLDDVVSFMEDLNEAQREVFKTLVPLVKNVDLAESKWDNASRSPQSKAGDDQDKVVALAAQMVKDKKTANMGEALTMARRELNLRVSQTEMI